MKEKINQTAGRLKQTVRAVGVGIATLTASFFMSAPAYAAGVQDSQIVKGTEKLVGDVTTWLMVLAPVVAGLLKHQSQILPNRPLRLPLSCDILQSPFLPAGRTPYQSQTPFPAPAAPG